MTVSSTTRRKEYTGNSSTTEFAYDFKIFEDSDLTVTLHTIASGAETILTLNTDYTVSGEGTESGGNVTTVSTYSSDYKIIIERILPLTQETDYIEGDDFPAESHEEALDRMVMICQQIQAKIDRSLVQGTSATSSLSLPVPTAGTYLKAVSSTELEWDDLTVTETDYDGDISHGADASKSATPSVGDIYLATDTQKLYFCYTALTWTAFGSSLSSGLFAALPATCSVGEMYLATNTKDLYACYSTNTWTKYLDKAGSLNFVIDGGGSAITTGIKGDIQIPFACTIQSVTMLADQTGSIVVDIWKDTYTNFPPTDADSITDSAVPTITTATKSTDATLTGWTVAVTAGDILRFNVDSCTSITRCSVVLKYTK